MIMVIPSTLSWQKRRSEFNHDWLKNQYLTALGSWLNLLDLKISDPVLESSFIKGVLPQWENRGPEALCLAASFEQEMSPRCLFNHFPLSQCDDDTKSWLGDLIHNLWLVRYKVKDLVQRVNIEAEEANKVYNHLQTVLHGCEDIQSVSALVFLREPFADFRTRCQNLAKAIEVFPTEIKVI